MSALPIRSATLWLLAIRDVDTDLTSAAAAAALVLRSYMSEDGACWPAVSSVARGMRLSERTAQRALGELEAAGWLSRTRRGPHQAAKYHATLPDDPRMLALLRDHIGARKDAANLTGHLPADGSGVTPVSPLNDPRGDIHDARGDTHVTLRPNEDLKPPLTPQPAAPRAGRRGGGNQLTMKTATDPSAGPDDHRRPEDISDSEWVAWQADPLQPAGTTIYQWACFRRALRAMAPENGVEASALVLGAHWRQFKNRRELVVLMRHCADIEKEATWDALVSRPCADKLPYVGANNIPAAMLARLRTLAAVLDHRQGERTLLAPEVEGNLSRLFARQDEYSTSS